MIEVVEYMFSSFWHWVGGLVYLTVIFGGLSGFITIKKGKS